MSELIKIIIGVFNSTYIETILFPCNLLNKNEYLNVRSLFLVFLSLPLLYYVDYIMIPYRITVIVIIYSIIIKFIYKKDIKISFVVGIYSYSMGYLSDAINSLMYLKVFKMDINYILQHHYLQYIMYLSFLTISILVCYIIKPRDLFNETEEFLLNKDSRTVTKYIVTILLFMSLLGYLVVTQLYLSSQHIASVLSLIMFIVINDMYIKQIKITAKTKSDFDEIFYYSMELEKTQNLLRKKEHEYKNQLITINILTENKDYYKINPYIDDILKTDNLVTSCIDTDYELIKDVLLKQLLIYKTNRAVEQGIQVESMIVQEINNINTSTYELSNIINIIMDNAIEAAFLSDKKIICIIIYREDSKTNIVVGNTYKDMEIYIDMYEEGISSKGKGRGNGLAILHDIEENNHNIQINTMVKDEMFIQEIIINEKSEDR